MIIIIVVTHDGEKWWVYFDDSNERFRYETEIIIMMMIMIMTITLLSVP